MNQFAFQRGNYKELRHPLRMFLSQGPGSKKIICARMK